MKVILRQEIETLGDKDEIKNVATGYARNYLIPRGLALPADEKNMKDLERRRIFAKRREDKLEKSLAESAEKIRGAKIEIEVRAGVEGKLYGSVSAKEIAADLTKKFKMEIDKKRVKLHDPIKRVGEYTVPLKLRENLTVDIIVVVSPNAQSDKPEPVKEPEPEAPAAEEKAVPRVEEDDTESEE